MMISKGNALCHKKEEELLDDLGFYCYVWGMEISKKNNQKILPVW